MDDTKYTFVLTTGLRVTVELEIDPADVEYNLTRGTWFTDSRGFVINPTHVVMFRKCEAEGP